MSCLSLAFSLAWSSPKDTLISYVHRIDLIRTWQTENRIALLFFSVRNDCDCTPLPFEESTAGIARAYRPTSNPTGACATGYAGRWVVYADYRCDEQTMQARILGTMSDENYYISQYARWRNSCLSGRKVFIWHIAENLMHFLRVIKWSVTFRSIKARNGQVDNCDPCSGSTISCM